MAIRYDVRSEDLNTKIDKLMAARTPIIGLRSGHFVEMRAIPGDNQKVACNNALKELEVLAKRIKEFKPLPTHHSLVRQLHSALGRKKSFWTRLES